MILSKDHFILCVGLTYVIDTYYLFIISVYTSLIFLYFIVHFPPVDSSTGIFLFLAIHFLKFRTL